MADIFRSNNLLIECLAGCNKTNERKILELGLLPWREICLNVNGINWLLPYFIINLKFLIFKNFWLIKRATVFDI